MIESEPTAPAMDPARAAEIRRQLTAVATALLDAILAGVDGAPSMGTSVQERILSGAIRPFLPQLRFALLTRLSEADPIVVERMMGASSTAIESILYYAPGEPQPRYVFDWTPDGLALRPAPPAEPAA